MKDSVTKTTSGPQSLVNLKCREKVSLRWILISIPQIFVSMDPVGFEADYNGLTNYFIAIREAFDERSIKRGIIVGEGNYIACQTLIEGKFVKEFTQSPARPLPPNGKHIVFDLMNIFRFDNQGRLVEEWVMTDNRGLLEQLMSK